MLTHLKVSGFKNLVDVDVYFGPFTCVAGANGVGKSNLFDAIIFLSALADFPLAEAALSIRDEEGKTSDIRSIFHRVGDEYSDEMSFEAEMIVPEEAIDDLGQKAKASITFLRYAISLAYRSGEHSSQPGTLELIKEELEHVNLGDATKHLFFQHSVDWRRSALKGRRTSPFISTEEEDGKRIIKLHQDRGSIKDGGGGGGRTLSRLAKTLPRTVLSASNAAESRTALVARREMQSWRLLQLEPSALRKPDPFTAPTRLGSDGSHLAATINHLARIKYPDGSNEGDVYAKIANRLAELIDDVYEVWIDRDERRELFNLYVKDRDGTSYPAKALSDGTLRFLALTVIELDPSAQGILCLEEPENGIHPERIPAVLRLLQDIATDVDEPIGPDNPLRQVIVNTHSPAVVGEVPDDSLLIAELKEKIQDGKRFKRVCFSGLRTTWRENIPNNENFCSRGQLAAYLNPSRSGGDSIKIIELEYDYRNKARRKLRRIVDREDMQILLPFPQLSE